MADLSTYLVKILSAVYGEEVRGAIHDAIAAMNEESTSAMTYAKDAQDSAYNSADSAADSQANASISESEAEKSKTEAKSWAVGGTGTRSGENTNNAKYWSERAEDLVFTADTSGAAGIVQNNLDAHAADNTLHIVPIFGDAAPTTATVGVLGQAFILTTAARIWQCTAINDGVYTWSEMLNVIRGTTAPNNQTVGERGQLYINTSENTVYICIKVFTTITAYSWVKLIHSGNIDEQTVDKANYATDTVAYGTPALRNEYFVAAEATPTINGQIAWLYG